MKLAKKKPSAEIFTGSMADVTFLLIIYFMLTMAFSSTKGLDFQVPKEDPTRSEVQAEEAVFFQVRADGSFVVDNKPMPLEQVANYLRTKIDPGSNPPVISKPIILRPAPQAPYGAMMEAFDELRQVKTKLNLAKDLNITLPTQREVENVWGALGVLTP
ncbi:MAG: biopolymer transporter ExbD [Thermoanaerobaculaceae bacterium]|nr:biopolymer transporter ExbD [Thermoanaerobaculaceae bacterium]